MVQHKTKRLVLVALICLLSASFSFADDFTSDSAFTLTSPLSVSDDGYSLYDYSTYSLSLSPEDTNGLKAVLLDLIGDYETEVTDYEYRNTQGSIQHSISIERDWVWIMSCCLFIVFLFGVFRFFYLLIKAV